MEMINTFIQAPDMARIKIKLPDTFSFVANIPVRITDINYGGHVGNDTILSIIHEARMQFLHHHGYTEMNMAGAGLIMSDAAIEFKSELFYGESVAVAIAVADITKVSFELYYRMEKNRNGKNLLVAVAKTGMLCYDYEKKKIIHLPSEVRAALTS